MCGPLSLVAEHGPPEPLGGQYRADGTVRSSGGMRIDGVLTSRPDVGAFVLSLEGTLLGVGLEENPKQTTVCLEGSPILRQIPSRDSCSDTFPKDLAVTK